MPDWLADKRYSTLDLPWIAAVASLLTMGHWAVAVAVALAGPLASEIIGQNL